MRQKNWLQRVFRDRSHTARGATKERRSNHMILAVEQLEARTMLTSGWVTSISGPASEIVSDLTGDATGNTYVTGKFSSQPSLFGNLTLSSDNLDLFVAKQNANGQYLWATKAGSPTSSNETSQSIAVDSAGNVFVTGYFEGTAQFGAQSLTSAGGYDVFVAKLDGNTGEFLWAQRRGNSGHDRGGAIVVDHSGSVIVSGDLDGASATSTDSPVVFVSKLGTDGTEVWTSTATGAMTGTLWSVEVDTAGDVYAAGRFQGTADFPTGTRVSSAHLPSASGVISSDALVTKLDSSDGHWLWARQFSGDTLGVVRSATVAPGGQLYVTGQIEGTVNFDAASLTSSGKQDGFVARLDPASGAVYWARRVGGSDLDNLLDIKVDPQGNINVVGTFRGTADFGPQILTADGGIENAFVTKLNPSGTILDTDRFITGTLSGTTNIAVPVAGVNIDAAGNLYIGGWFAGGTVQFPQQPVSGSYSTGYVVKLPPNAATKFYVVNDSVANRTYQYATGGDLAIENFGLGTGNTSPRGAASTAAGDKLWVVDANRTVYVYNNNGTLLGSWVAGTLGTNAIPEGITVSATGDVWIVDATSDKVFKYAGAASRISGTQTAASNFNLNKSNSSPTGIVTDGASLWVVNSSGSDRVFKYNVSGTLLGKWAIDAANSSPTGITINPANVSDIWVVDNVALKIFQYTAAASRISGSQNASATFALASGNTNPQDIADPPAPTASSASMVMPATSPANVELPVFRPNAPQNGTASPSKSVPVRQSIGVDWLSCSSPSSTAITKDVVARESAEQAIANLLGDETYRRLNGPLRLDLIDELFAELIC